MISRLPKISIIIPIFNEEALLHELIARVGAVMSGLDARGEASCELVLVNDGSRDSSLSMLHEAAKQDSRLVIVDLSRNFGHQSAIQAGMEISTGDAIAILDGDLQDPPELIEQLIAEWKKGFSIVIAKRRSRAESGLRKLLFNTFYKVLGRLSDFPIELNAGHFSIIDRKAVNDLLALKERNRFLPGLRAWVGYSQGFIYYDREERLAGAPKMTFFKLLKYGFDAIFSFSYKPLRAIWSIGFVVSTLCILYAFFLIILRIFNINVVQGFTTPTVATLFLGGVQLISVGILGEYLGRIYDEVKQRPLYIIRDVYSTRASESDTVSQAKPIA
ncbi:MAG: glycosyltransferase family 2 protein [Candidatus Kapaibacterium sp.]|jgi:glycosyltransferase involved in cell wall biosynthesis